MSRVIRSARRFLPAALKLVVLAASAWYLSGTVDPGALRAAFRGLGPGSLAVLAVLVGLYVGATTQSLRVLCSLYREVPFPTVLKVDIFSFVLNSFIPSRAGSVVSVPLLLHRFAGVERRRGLVVQSVQLSVTALVNGVAIAVGVAVLWTVLSPEMRLLAAVGGGVYLAIPVTGLLLARSGSRVSGLVRLTPLSRLWDHHVAEEGLFSSVSVTDRRILTSLALMALSVVVLAGVRFGVVATSLGVELPLLHVLLLPPLIYSVTVLPISFGGIGVAEAVGVTVLAGMGVSPAAAAGVVLVDRAVSYYAPLLVFYAYTNLSVARGGARDGSALDR